MLCIEEPENGIHPERLPSMEGLMRDLAVDTDSAVGDGNVMRQLILATHSPYLLQLQEPADILIAKETTKRYDEVTVPCVRCYPLAGTWRADKSGPAVLGLSTMHDYLQPPDGAKLRMPFELSSRSVNHQTIRFVLLCEGTSDRPLVAHLRHLLSSCGASEAVGSAIPLSTIPDHRDHRGSPLARKIQTALTAESEFDLLFVHRDANSAGYDARLRE